jgi:hypothetical protein
VLLRDSGYKRGSHVAGGWHYGGWGVVYTQTKELHIHRYVQVGPTEVPKLETEAAPISKPERPPYNVAASFG